MPDEKKGFGAKLKGVGKAIGRQLKKVPGVAYREVIKPYGEHLRDKFTEPLEKSTPTLRRQNLPGSQALSKAYRTTVSTEQAPTVEPYRAEQRTSLKRGPGKERAFRGKTTSYDRPAGSLSAVGRLNKLAEEQAKAAGTAPKTTPKAQAAPAPTRKPAPTPKVAGEYVEVIGEAPKPPPPKPPAVRGMTKKKPKRKFSPKKTAETLRKAGKARQEAMEKVQIDTTALEVARMMTEQDVGREAERAEVALKQGRRPRREKSRYRYQTRGYKRSEGRGR